MSLQVSDLVYELPKSTLPAGSAIVGGQYVFYVSGPTPLRCDYACRNGDALILSTGGNAAVHYGEGLFSYSTDCWVIEPIHEKVEGKFLYFHLSSQIVRIDALGFEGSGLRHLRKNFIRHYPVPEFPRCEQTKIAEVLSTVDRAIEQTEALIAKQQRIETGLMQDLLTRGIDEHGNLRSEEIHEFKESPQGRIPGEWGVTTVGDTLMDITYGLTVRPKYVEEGIPLVSGKECRDGWIDYDACNKITQRDFGRLRERSMPKPGHVLITKTGTLGRVARIKESDPVCAITQNVALLKPNVAKISSEFLEAILNSEKIQRDIHEGVSVLSIPDLQLGVLENFTFPLPNLSEQNRIVKKLTSLYTVLSVNRNHLKKLRSLKTALMQDLLTGKVRVTPLLSEPEEAES